MRLPSTRALPSLITDAAVALYGLWTVACNLTVVLEGNTYTLRAISTLVLALATCAAVIALRRRRLREAYLADLDGPTASPVALSARTRGLLLAAIVAIATSHALGMGALWIWAQITILCCAAALLGTTRLAPPEQQVPTPLGRTQHLALHALALGCALFALASFRPRTDDAFYVNMAVAVADVPDAPLLRWKNLHGPPTDTLPPQRMFPPYRVHSFEALGGYLSFITGIEALKVIHFGLATLFAWLVPFALARALRVIVPRYWLLGVAVAVAYYCIEGSAPRGYANQALVRMFNGKAALLSVGVPLICAYGVRFGMRPNAWRMTLLALAQVGAMGMSSTGIWIAPLLGSLSVAAASPLGRKGVRTLFLGAISAAPVLAMGLWARAQMGLGTVALPDGTSLEAVAMPPAVAGIKLLSWVIPTVLGSPSTAATVIITTGLALALAPTALAFRLLSAVSVTIAVALANPWLATEVARSLTGPLTYERIFWLMPFPLALGLAAVGLFELARRHTRRGWPAAVLVVCATTAFFVSATEELVISRENHARLLWPPVLKVWPVDRAVAMAACRHGPRGVTILAPLGVSHQLVSMPGCGHPLQAGMRWMSAERTEERARNLMQAFVGKQLTMDMNRTDWFMRWLDGYGVKVVVMDKKGVHNREVKGALRRAGWELSEVVEGALIWIPVSEKTRTRIDVVARGVCKRALKDAVIASPFQVAAALPEQCGRALMRTSKTHASTPRDVELTRLEGFLSSDQSATKEDAAWIRKQLRAARASIVVLTGRADKDRAVRRELKALGLKRDKAMGGHRIYVRAGKGGKRGRASTEPPATPATTASEPAQAP